MSEPITEEWLKEVGFTLKTQRRFWAKVNLDGPESGLVDGRCWLWTGATTKTRGQGYGHFCLRHGVLLMAHRVGYELVFGPIPQGLQLDHVCRTQLCVRADHLEPVTQQVNLLRGDTASARNSRKTHCNRGHEFIGENYILRRGAKECVICRRMRAQSYRLAKSR